MATTASAFLKKKNATLTGATVGAAGDVVAMNETSAAQLDAAGYGTRLDKAGANAATDGFAKNGGATVTMVGTTPVTISLADLTSNTASSAGDTAFATWNRLTFTNTSAGDATIAPAASNPANILLAGTSPTLTVCASNSLPLASTAGITVDSTHKSITITPSASGTMLVTVEGA